MAMATNHGATIEGHDDEAEPRPQQHQPARRALAPREGRTAKAGDHRTDRALDQDGKADRDPEDERIARSRPLPPRPREGPRQGAHGGDATGGEHRVGLGEPRLGAEQERGRHEGGREEGPAPRDQGERRPIGQQHGRQRADERGQPVEPRSWCAPPGRPTDSAAANDGGLQPIDADRLLVARLVLEADVDEVAALQHLLGGLSEARLVAVHRLQCEEARQEGGERDRQKHDDGAGVRRFEEAQRPLGAGAAGGRRRRSRQDVHDSSRARIVAA